MQPKQIAKFLKEHIEKIIFSLLSLSIVAPLLRSGYILTLDMIFAPKMNFNFPPTSGVYADIQKDFILHSLAQIIPADIIEKVILLILFYIIPAAFYKFLSIFEIKNKYTKPLKILASTMYLWNPFVYERLMAGNWLFLFGYALAPLFLLSLVRLSKSSDGKSLKKYFLISIILWTLISYISFHHFFLFGLIFLVCFIVSMVSTKGKSFPKLIPTFLISMLLNSFWIAPTLLYGSHIQTVTGKDLLLFASTPDDKLGIFWNLFTFYGFWAEKLLMNLPKDILPLWPLPFMLLLFPLSYLLLLFIPKKLQSSLWFKTKIPQGDKLISITLIILGLSGIVLSMGSLGIAKPIYDVFYDKIPLLKPFRESQKFLSLYVLSFCGLFYISFQTMIEKLNFEHRPKFKANLQKKINNLAIYFLIGAYFVLTFLLTFTLFWGANGQLKSTNYPKSWVKLEEASAGKGAKILVLPFQSYAKFSFNERRISNPAPLFFSADVISKQTLDELTKGKCEIECKCLCLNKTDGEEIWYDKLKESSVQYVLINKNDDWEDYEFLRNSEHFHKIIEDAYSYTLEVD